MVNCLKKRDNFRICFNHFDAGKIAKYDQKKINSLLNNTGIIRHRLKIESTIVNAQAFLAIQNEYDSFSNYIWQMIGGKPIQNHWKKQDKIPSYTSLSDKLSRDLKRRGFKFLGRTICYAFMQATGMVNDHTMNCFRYKQLK